VGVLGTRRSAREEAAPAPNESISRSSKDVKGPEAKKGPDMKRPKGRAPAGKRWNTDLGDWEADTAAEEHAGMPSRSNDTKRKRSVDSDDACAARPPGKTPKGQQWNTESGTWEAIPVSGGAAAAEIPVPDVSTNPAKRPRGKASPVAGAAGGPGGRGGRGGRGGKGRGGSQPSADSAGGQAPTPTEKEEKASKNTLLLVRCDICIRFLLLQGGVSIGKQEARKEGREVARSRTF
jgi:hypothetical protein